MKVDAPAEDETKQGMHNRITSNVVIIHSILDNKVNEETENNTSGINDIKPSQICSPILARPILASSRFTSASPTSTSSNSILRPSQLGSNNNNNTSSSSSSSSNNNRSSFSLNPSRLNPFIKLPTTDTNEEKPLTNNVSHTNGETPKFVPLVQTENNKAPVVKPVTTTVPAAASNFVFGQNLEERVIADGKTDEPKPSTSLNSNGTVDMLFTSAASKAAEVTNVQNKETKSLSESAREYEESRAVKRKFEEVEIITGEEGETNVLQVSCKLFSFDKASGSWQERGQGNLRLNDFEVKDGSESYSQSRLVFRTVGGLRVILNTKVSGCVFVTLISFI